MVPTSQPAKRGFKIFVLADGHSGYTSNIELYLRKKEKGLTQRVVEDLMRPVYQKNHIVFVDKYYTWVSLALSLLKNGTHLNGSFNVSRSNWPSDLKMQIISGEMILFVCYKEVNVCTVNLPMESLLYEKTVP